MKKLIPLITILLFSSQLFAQGKFEIGLESGPNISSIRGNEIVENNMDSRIGFYGGLSLQYNISEQLAIRSGLAFTRKGSSAVDSLALFDSLSGTFQTKGRLYTCSDFDYVSIPLLLRFSFGKNKIT